MSNRLPIETQPTALLQWQFRRGNQDLTCTVCAEADAYTVMTLPHGDLEHGALETFAEPASALQRHAVIATQLRETGWSLTSYTH